MYLLFVFIFSLISCRTTSSEVKDAELNPRNISDAPAVVWQGSDEKVHYSICPLGSSPINRSCNGIQEKAVLPGDRYKEKLTTAIIENRANGANAGTTLSAEEQKVFAGIITTLQAGNDVIYDDGETRFFLAQVPFGVQPNYPIYRLVPTAAINPTNCGNTLAITKIKFKINHSYEDSVINSSSDPYNVDLTIAGFIVKARSSSSWAGEYGVEKAFVQSNIINEGWIPTEFLGATNRARKKEYIEVKFPIPVRISGIQFAPIKSNPACAVKSFQLEASKDGSNFMPLTRAARSDIVWNGADAQNFEWSILDPGT